MWILDLLAIVSESRELKVILIPLVLALLIHMISKLLPWVLDLVSILHTQTIST